VRKNGVLRNAYLTGVLCICAAYLLLLLWLKKL